MRCGPRTYRLSDLPQQAKVLRKSKMFRYCWAVGAPLAKAFRRRALEQRMRPYRFEAIIQPRLLVRYRLFAILKKFASAVSNINF